MSMLDVAKTFDRRGAIIEAAWAYEIAIRDLDADMETSFNLVAIYLAANDFGFSSAHRLDQLFVDTAFPRAMDVLSEGEKRFGPSPEIDAWRSHLRERVLGDDVSLAHYARLARQGSEMASLQVYIHTREMSLNMDAIFDRHSSLQTERDRLFMSFYRDSTGSSSGRRH